MKNGVVKFAVILTVLGALGAIATYYKNPTELIFSLTIGAGANFLFWFVVGTIFVWVKNKLQRSPKSQPGKELPLVAELKPGISGSKKCPNCSRENLPDVLFCNYCGHKFNKPCSNCGRENLPDASTCGYCGATFQDNVIQVMPAITAVGEAKIAKRKLALEQQKIKRTSLFVILFIGLVLFCIFLGMSGSFKGLQQIFTPTPTKTATAIPTPTRDNFWDDLFSVTQPGAAKPTMTPDPCIRWDNVSADLVGKRVCVYGVVLSITGGPDTGDYYKLHFHGDSTSFIIRSEYYFNWFDTIECIEITGELKYHNYFYIELPAEKILEYRDIHRCQ
jgi:hypothetical protein